VRASWRWSSWFYLILFVVDFAPGSGGHHPPGREGRGSDGDDGSEDVSCGVLHGPSISYSDVTLHRRRRNQLLRHHILWSQDVTTVKWLEQHDGSLDGPRPDTLAGLDVDPPLRLGLHATSISFPGGTLHRPGNFFSDHPGCPWGGRRQFDLGYPIPRSKNLPKGILGVQAWVRTSLPGPTGRYLPSPSPLPGRSTCRGTWRRRSRRPCR